MPKRRAKRSPSQTATASTPEGELRRHLQELGLESAEAYRAWCASNAFRPALEKSWQERRAEIHTARRLAEERAVQAEIERHWTALGFADADQYAWWCRHQGFSTGLRKSAEQRRREREVAERERAQRAMAGTKRRARRPEEVIQALEAGEISPDELKTPSFVTIQSCFAGMADPAIRQAFLRLLLRACRQTDLLSTGPAVSLFGPQPGNTLIEGLAALAGWHHAWQGDPEEWRSGTHNGRRQFGALARHLLARYFVPPFMDAAWFMEPGPEARRRQGWFVHVGTGHNIRTADIPMRLTKRMAHHFLLAPHDLTLEGALRWGQIHGLGGDEYLARAVAATRLGELQEDEAFWLSFLHFLVNNPMLDRSCIGPMADFIHHRKFEPQETVEDGEARLLAPPEPGFSMKGRTVPALWNRVEEWHRQLARNRKAPPMVWEPSGIGGFELEERDTTTGYRVRWRVQELLSRAELVEEGRAMHHCVASYARSCAHGGTSIWSIRQEEMGQKTARRAMTVEVHNGRRHVVQARGHCNKGPNDRRASIRLSESGRILRLWAAQERLTVPSHIF